jgi:carboxymethylenebutenolidase
MNKDITVGGAAAYHSYPDTAGKHPGLVLIEAIWGVDAHIRDVADRFAEAGYSVVAPELLPAGLLEQMTPQLRDQLFNPETRAEVQPKLRAAMAPIMQPEFAEGALATLKACVDYLMADEHCNGQIAVLGFCFGGTYTFHLAANDTRIKAAVPFYGQAPSADEVAKITCPVLGLYGDEDAPLMESLPALKDNMQKSGKDFQQIVYPGARHAFFDDSTPRTYNAAAATDAWDKATAFLQKHLAN